MHKEIILTGNIGTGKSTVTEIFKEYNYEIISSDEISNEILKKNHEKVSKMFSMPPQKYEDFKKRLSNMIFSKSQEYPYNFKEQLEELMIPLIKEEIKNIIYSLSKNKKYIVEAPTFFEINCLKKYTDKTVIMIKTDKDIRVQHILERNKHLSIQDVLDRIKRTSRS